MLYVSYLGNRYLIHCHKSLCFMFPSNSFIGLALKFRSLIYSKSFLYVVWSRDPNSFFCMWLPSCTSTIYWKGYSFLPVNYLGILVKNQLTRSVLVCFWTLNLIPLVYTSVFMPVLPSLDYCSFEASFEIRKWVLQLGSLKALGIWVAIAFNM